MPPRFWSSPFKNAVANPAKREGWYAELPLATALLNETSDGIQAAGEYWLALGNASGTLLAIPHATGPGKFGSRAPSLSIGLRSITSFAADAFDDLLYVGGDKSAISVFDLPPVESFSNPTAPPLAPKPLFSLSTGTSKPVDVLAPHPLASGVALASSGASLSVFDAAVKGEIVKTFEQPSPAWSAQWSKDGRSVTATGRDGKLRVWDVRAGEGVVAETLAHAGLKPSRHVHLSPSSSGAFQILTTGTTKTRDREYSLFDLRNLPGGPIKTQRVDTNTGVLQPVLDEARGIVYLAGRGDMTLRWVEVGGPSVFTEGYAPLPAPLLSAALLPPRAQQKHLDLQHAEVNRLLVLTNDSAVVPVSVAVPRRQYVDFFPELYPPVSTGVPALSAADWLAGQDEGALLEKRQLEPGRSWPNKERLSTATSPSAQPSAASTASVAQSAVQEAKEDLPPPVPVATTAPPAPAPTGPAATPTSSTRSFGEKAEETSIETKTEEPPTASLSSLSLGAQQTRPTFGGAKKTGASPSPAPSAAAPSPAVTTQPSPAPPAAATVPASAPSSAPSPSATVPFPSPPEFSATSASPASKPPASATTPPAASNRAPGERFNPNWSRKFLTGKTSLKPEYYDVKDVSATTSPDVTLLKATSLFFFYPLSGPGGRLAVHPLSQKGRLPPHIAALQSGTTLVDFEVDPFNPRRAVIAGDDGAVRVFEVPEGEGGEGWAEKVGEAQGQLLSDSKMDRINALSFHPAAKNVLLSVSDDHGNPTARVWDVEKGEVIVQAALPKGGVSSASWSPEGTLLAVATKNKQLHVLDPRRPSSVVSSPSHDSVRPARVAWASEQHLVTTGFNRAASRELQLYELDSPSSPTKLSQLAKNTLDVSPAPLSVFVDLDTHILLAYSRGERSCLAYELSPEAKDKFTLLPKFDHGTLQSAFAYFPKTAVDVKSVEVIRAVRLTPSEVQVVSFQIPRAKVERFQDDVFVETAASTPSMSASDYKDGRDKPRERVNLRPDGMELLSEAPPPAVKKSTKSLIKQDGLTDSQRAEAEMDRLFKAAKDEGAEESEDEEVKRKTQAPDDDDW